MTLPLILAGPILRRADENQVYVWLVTSFDPAAGLELEILDVSDPKRENPIQATSELKTCGPGRTSTSVWPAPIRMPGYRRSAALTTFASGLGVAVYRTTSRPSTICTVL